MLLPTSHYNTARGRDNTDLIVKEINAQIDHYYKEGRQDRINDSYFCVLASTLSRRSIKNATGGPFGALIVEYEGGLDDQGHGIGKPWVIGVGTNHVFPESDPTAHAEMEAYRDAVKRLGYSDLSNTVLFTSCECCPMCLSCANGAGIGRIVYVNTRGQAGTIKFADKIQYDLFKLPCEKYMTPIAPGDDSSQTAYRTLLTDGENVTHGAVVVDESGQVVAYGDDTTDTDPTGVPSLNAVRAACQKRKNFALRDCHLVSLCIPHPAGVVAADWAKMLRHTYPEDGEHVREEDCVPHTRGIMCLSPEFEQVHVRGRDEKLHLRQDAELTYRQPALPDTKRAIRTEISQNRDARAIGLQTFSDWRRGTAARY